MGGALNILLEGRPGVGKTTLVRRLGELVHRGGVPLAGFTTEEIRVGRRRVGFKIETMSGEDDVLAHVDLSGPPRVGKYGVDVATFERLALPALDGAPGELVVVDEIGKMEITSDRFREAVTALFDSESPVVATVQIHRHAFTDALKARQDAEVVRVTEANRDRLPDELADRLIGALKG